MIVEADTEIVINYDCDVILPIESYETAYHYILDEIYDVVYPYAEGQYQFLVKATDENVSHFLQTNDYKHLEKYSQINTSEAGWVQFFKRSVYIEGGMENENFKAYAPEDKERIYRFKTLGYNVGRISNFIYHLDHVRGENSWFSNPHMQSNMSLWEKLQNMDKNELINYYSKQDYLKKYKL